MSNNPVIRLTNQIVSSQLINYFPTRQLVRLWHVGQTYNWLLTTDFTVNSAPVHFVWKNIGNVLALLVLRARPYSSVLLLCSSSNVEGIIYRCWHTRLRLCSELCNQQCLLLWFLQPCWMQAQCVAYTCTASQQVTIAIHSSTWLHVGEALAACDVVTSNRCKQKLASGGAHTPTEECVHHHLGVHL